MTIFRSFLFRQMLVKTNPYHDENGRFTTEDGATGQSDDRGSDYNGSRSKPDNDSRKG